MNFDPERIARALQLSWSSASARQWAAENTAAGQCNVTALIINEFFGGELLRTTLPEGDHFYNRIAGRRYDFTDSQFERPIVYADYPATRPDIERGVTDAELAALRSAFRELFRSLD